MRENSLDPSISEICFLVSDLNGACSRFEQLYGVRPQQEAVYSARDQSRTRLLRYPPENGLRFTLFEACGAGWTPFRQPRLQALHHICHRVTDYKAACRIAGQNGLDLLSEGIVESDGGMGRQCAFYFDGVLGSVIQLLEDGAAEKPAESMSGTILGMIGTAHVGYLTADREAVLAHLEKLYGLHDWLRVEYKPGAARCYGREVQGQYYVKAAVVPGAEGCSFEINQPVSKGAHQDYLGCWQNHINHICHKIKDFEYWRDYFVGLGCKELFSAEMEDELMGYRRCFYAYDSTLNAVFELMEKPHFRR